MPSAVRIKVALFVFRTHADYKAATLHRPEGTVWRERGGEGGGSKGERERETEREVEEEREREGERGSAGEREGRR